MKLYTLQGYLHHSQFQVLPLQGSQCQSHSRSPDVPQYIIVKVGHSANPAHHICEIMGGFKYLGAADTEFQQLKNSDGPDTTIEKGKSEPKIVFIRKCYASNEREIEAAEENIRKLILAIHATCIFNNSLSLG